jgi:uncharacterized protein involved in exopolysaccharide biosynthesis
LCFHDYNSFCAGAARLASGEKWLSLSKISELPMNLFDTQRTESVVLNLYRRNWKIIAITVIVCTLLAVVATNFMKEPYRAKASFFIPYDVSLEKTLESPQFGYDIEADRLLQLLNSEQLKDSVVKRFDLVKYFGIDTTDYTWPQALSDKYHQRIFANRTNIMSIVVEAETHDPEYSAEIVNYVVSLLSRMRQTLYKTNSKLAAEVFNAEYRAKKAVVDSLAVKIGNLRKDGQGNYPLLNNMILTGTLQNSSPEKEILTQQFIHENNQLNDLRVKCENARNISERPIPSFYNIDQAFPIYKASYPILGFNVAVGFFGSLFFMLVAFYLKHVVQQLRTKR